MFDYFVPNTQISELYTTAARYKALYGGKNEKYFTQCYGCQQNEADTERIDGICEEMGYIRTENAAEASLIIINTCAIREHAEQKALSVAGSLKKLKEANPSLLIGLCGCMVQEPHRREQITKSYPYVDFMFGTDKIHMLASLIERARVSPRRISLVSDEKHDEFGVIAEGLPVRRASDIRSWVSIMYGCNNFCSYCVVPYVRGRERSRNADDVIEEVKKVVSDGAREITLLGQNVNSYNSPDGTDFPTLLGRVCAVAGDFRVRFMTSHPKDCSDRLIDVCRDAKVAPHFHLPFQAGSDRILGLMNRRYTKEQYLERAYRIRSVLPDTAVTTDIICGFPSETDAEFLETLDVVEKVRFDMIYTFLYSPREGTRAAKMEEQIPHDEKVRRFTILNERENVIAEENNKNLIGTVQRVLCDGVSDGKCTGRSGQNKIVTFESDEIKYGDFCDIEITSAQAYSLGGKPKNER